MQLLNYSSYYPVSQTGGSVKLVDKNQTLSYANITAIVEREICDQYPPIQQVAQEEPLLTILNCSNNENVKEAKKSFLLPENWLKNRWLLEVELNNNCSCLIWLKTICSSTLELSTYALLGKDKLDPKAVFQYWWYLSKKKNSLRSKWH